MDAWFPLLSIIVGTTSQMTELVLKGSGYMEFNEEKEKCYSRFRYLPALDT
jgi:hypothetical protein